MGLLVMGGLVLNNSYLKFDACIIAEDDDYLVLSVRVPKTTIQRNGELMAAIADHANVARTWAPYLPPQRRPLALLSIAACAAGAILFLGDALDVSRALTAPVSPYTIESVQYLSGPDADNTIKTHFEVIVGEVCRRTADMVIIKKSDGDTALRWSLPVTPRAEGRHSFDSSLRVPARLPPGDYIWRARVQSFCGTQESATLTPDVPFSVSEKS